MSASDFRDLEVWKKSRAMAINVYGLTDKGALARDFGLKDQMRRAAVSICSNIAEGNERGTDRDTVRFLQIAKGSSAELLAQADIAAAVGYLTQEESEKLTEDCKEVGRMLGGLIKYRQSLS
ncbi:MAG TPA: four helix bundle protein [Burkholderiales bacterium]|jgi:four helix bundle protein|nr:four helix bundle protein [Burkholderiales bacterium]